MDARRSTTLMSLFFFATTFFLISRSVSAVGSLPRVQATTNELDFIRTSCNATLYPDVCFSSLSAYASAVQANPARLARLAVVVTLSRAKSTAAYLATLSHAAEYDTDHRAAAALHDCFTNIGDAIDDMRGSLRQLRQIRRPAAESFRFQMSNVQTWMSAALTDEDTCTDGFADVVDGKTKTAVCENVDDVKKFTSNALAIVNRYAKNGTP